MLDLLAGNPLLVLFLVVSAGWVVGQVRVGGFALDVAAVLFVGLFVGAVNERLALPSVLGALGLVLFVYTVGIASGPAFVRAAAHRSGVAAIAGTVVLIGLVATAAALIVKSTAPGLGIATMAGMFAGATTNTPALATVLAAPLAATDAANQGGGASVGYALAYPTGVLVPLILTWWLTRGARRTRAARADSAEPMSHRPERGTVRVTAEHPGTLADLARNVHGVIVTRVRREGAVLAGDPSLVLETDDLVVLVGERVQIDRATLLLGEESMVHPEHDRSQLAQRVVVVSSLSIAERTIGELDLQRRFNTVVSRVRRGDVEIVATDDLVLELADRLKLVAPREQLPAVAKFFGDSYRSLRHLDLFSLSLGLSAGLLLGVARLPLPGDASLTLGAAGGPLIVGLVLGVVGRTGKLVWQLPHGTNLALRQLGAALFLAVVGTNAGTAFRGAISSPDGLLIVACGVAVTALLSLSAFVLARLLLRVDVDHAVGMVAALHTQPAVLAYADEQADDEDAVSAGYALLMPAAMITKIIAAQLLLR